LKILFAYLITASDIPFWSNIIMVHCWIKLELIY